MEAGKSYYLSNVAVKVYQSQKYFLTTGESEVKVVDGVDEVCQEAAENGSHKVVGQIVGDVSSAEFRS